MFTKLFGDRARAEVRPEAPPGRRIYAIGDIHGRVDLLRALHSMIEDDFAGAAGRKGLVVYLGDYVDRGSSSREVIDLLIAEPLAGFESVHLSGNHEEMMLCFLDDPTIGPMWMFNGGDATLLSYGIGLINADGADERDRMMREALRDRLPSAHLAFLRGLELYHVAGDYLFVHAGLVPGRPIEEQEREDMLWIREEFIRSGADHGKCVVHGHTVTDEPDIRANRIGIDTGACFTNRLSCLVLDGAEQRVLHT